jgi:cytochrome P450
MHLLNEAIWGPEPESFRPERWLQGGGGDENETEKEYASRIQAMKNASLAFGAGSRICMGRHLSMVQIMKLVPSLLLRYRFELVDTDKEWKVVCGWFVRQAEMDVFVETRSEWADGV